MLIMAARLPAFGNLTAVRGAEEGEKLQFRDPFVVGKREGDAVDVMGILQKT